MEETLDQRTSPSRIPGGARYERPAFTAVGRGALRELILAGAMSRSEVARRLNVSRASLTRVVRQLVGEGFVEELGASPQGVTGRPAEVLRVRSDRWLSLGVKITFDRLYTAVTTLNGHVIATREDPLPRTDPEAVVGAVIRLAGRMRSAHPEIRSIGVSLPGDVVERHGRRIVSESRRLGWRDIDLDQALHDATGLIASSENDVQALTAQEHWFGAGAGRPSMALVTIGVGIGLGLIENGRVANGAHGRLGRIDHIPVDARGPACDLGHRGCASSYLTSSAIARAAGHEGDYERTVELARAGDTAALRAFRLAGNALGSLLGTVMMLLDPATVVLTGDGMPVVDLARSDMERALAVRIAPYEDPVPVETKLLGFSEWARAAAVVAVRSLVGD